MNFVRELILFLAFVEKWPMMTPNEVGFILVTYFFILIIGPTLMKNRSPFKMRSFLIFFNGVKVVNSGILAFRLIALLYWKYMITKIWDLFDTVFFILRKKYSQLTFLHVYHHVYMVIMSWSCLKYDPSDHWAFTAVLNNTIHTVMYTYYGIAAMGPAYIKYLWWKKYVTIMQLVQFVLAILHLILLSYTSECPMHAGSYWVGIANLGFFICLFSDFYKKRFATCKVGNKEKIGFACMKQCTE